MTKNRPLPYSPRAHAAMIYRARKAANAVTIEQCLALYAKQEAKAALVTDSILGAFAFTLVAAFSFFLLH